MDKPQAWNLDDASNTSPYKDIVPGDQVNQRAAINAAYQQMGDSMAKEVQQDAQYKEDLKDSIKDAANVESNAIYASNIVGIDKATGSVVAYFFAKLVWWFTHPILGMKQSRTARLIFIASTMIVAAIVALIVMLGALGVIKGTPH